MFKKDKEDEKKFPADKDCKHCGSEKHASHEHKEHSPKMRREHVKAKVEAIKKAMHKAKK